MYDKCHICVTDLIGLETFRLHATFVISPVLFVIVRLYGTPYFCFRNSYSHETNI